MQQWHLIRAKVLKYFFGSYHDVFIMDHYQGREQLLLSLVLKECFLLARKDTQDKQSFTEYCILFNILTISLALCCSSFPEPVGTNFAAQTLKLTNLEF